MAGMKAVPSTNPAVLASLAGDDVPPAFPKDLRRTLGLASNVPEAPQLTPAQELDKLFPAEREVVVQQFVSKGPNGKKLREPLTIALEECTIEECAAIARPLQQLADAAETTVEGMVKSVPVAQLVHQHYGLAIDALTAASGVEADVLRGLRMSDLITVAEAAVEVNAGFFVRRLPMLMIKFETVVGRVTSAGQTSSSASAGPASPGLNS